MSNPPSGNRYTVTFVVVLCTCCALILAVMATSIRTRMEKARELDIAKQILQSAGLYNPKDSPAQIHALFQKSIIPMLTNVQGDIETFAEAGINEQEYITAYRVSGYYKQPEKLFYEIKKDGKTAGYIIPVAGFGLWGPIYGYLALQDNADTVIGATWEAPLETPGLGSIIQEPKWQAQFVGKKIFVPGADKATASLGITVVKGKVADVFGTSPRAETAVDGITGATLTGDGVTNAYKDSLAPYRAFLDKVGKQ